MRFDESPAFSDVVVAGVVLNEEEDRSTVPVPRLRIRWGILRAPGVCGQLGNRGWGSGDEDEELGEGEEEADGDGAAVTTKQLAPRRR